MVDQLWLWCSGHANAASMIQTGAANLAGEEGPQHLVPGIINECAGAFFDPMKSLEDDFRFLDMFSNSISRIADGKVACYERFVKMLRISNQQDLMEIDTESGLLREIKDILDELRMIRVVWEDQLKVIEALMVRFSNVPRPPAWNVMREPVKRYVEKVQSMQREGEATVNSPNALMDLRQRHATLWEAKSTGMQGNTITVFTVVTILFLPASFMASFFALPIVQFSKAKSSDSLDLSYVVK
ncbi:hypothetical protein BO86DRAFT_394608 [Aspergillus japonicus CBS 114.51]|uniref:Ankyrin repeat protein n=1 Tax=Aspergillus japonicus CBS 114.51 TaxID=1448312 RepID=A0A8T8XEU2_ASPJA|nr:hypothetical protein BO86DRAFT_394608 [Aspergillus japonicus CBS 114.51]RAH86813.1 hypothetical protein BO86DRAFT_394608 [Aspergillus japonicus CBS 114.51]